MRRRRPAESPEPDAAARGAVAFTTVIMLASVLLQRFAIPVGDQSLSVVGPIGMAAAGWGLLSGSLALHGGRVAVFFGLLCLAGIGTAFALVAAPPLLPPISWTSAAHFLGLTAFATLVFARPLEEARFFAAVQSALTLCAGLGLCQFAAQFALGPDFPGLFTFADLLPESVLIPGYNTVILAGSGSLLKSNGLTLVEPSVFSQFMALGLMIEIATFRRPTHLLLFPAGLVASVSGTGWLVLGVFLARVAVGQRTGILLAVATAVAGALALALLAFALPDIFAGLIERTDEVRRQGTSGHARFVTPWWLLDWSMAATPWAWLLGLGPGIAERLPVGYENAANVPVKLAIEYGFPAVVAYLALYLVAERTPRQSLLLPSLLMLVLFAGGYQQFPPVLFPALLLCCVAGLREGPAAAPVPARSAAAAPC